MKEQTVIDIYKKEREYQKKWFGDYKDKPLNFGSFLIFIERYLQKAKEAYCGQWEKDLPVWLNDSDEMEYGSAPVQAYADIIKVMALAGAALETYAKLDPYYWRIDPEEGIKWKE